uniref:Uncharacterized protein n=1 Tax=Tanacetum cinerariifolium TaxID=118510 RepID=A0A6L2LJF4_TANCI|nr:hypothetical protein [Tanacetum cinerariifolium]
MAPLPHYDLRHPWADTRLRDMTRVLYTVTSRDRLSMIYTGDDGQTLFTSHAQRRLFEIRGPLVREFMMELFSTCRMSDTEMRLNVADTLWAGFRAYWQGSERVILDKGDLRDYWMEISSDRDFLGPAPLMGQALEKMAGVDLFSLCNMDQGTANIPYILAQYLFRHAEGRKRGARLSEGHFIGRLASHFGLVSDQGLRGLSVVSSELIAAEDAPVVDEGAHAVPTLAHALQPPPPAPRHRTMTQRLERLEDEMRELR